MSDNKKPNIPLPERTVLKHYTIIKKIDTGGYSIVYYAYDQKMNNYVAIKEFMPSHLKLRTSGTEVLIKDDDTLRFYNMMSKMFFEEIRMINRINHPNVVKCIDYFTANNTIYLVTPYEVGEPLAVYMSRIHAKKMQLQEKDIIHITTGILKAVQEMHKNGVIHLDIKPNNIWLRPNKDVVILDFGTALLEGQRRSLMPYTSGFAAIELYANASIKMKDEFYKIQDKIRASRNDLIGRWTDYYAIGATIYNMITFSLPEQSYELYGQGKQLDTEKLYGTTHIKLIDAINKLCQHDIAARKEVDLQDIANNLRNAKPYPKYEMDLADIIGERPPYVMDLIRINR